MSVFTHCVKMCHEVTVLRVTSGKRDGFFIVIKIKNDAKSKINKLLNKWITLALNGMFWFWQFMIWMFEKKEWTHLDWLYTCRHLCCKHKCKSVSVVSCLCVFVGQRAGENHQEIHHRARQERLHRWVTPGRALTRFEKPGSRFQPPCVKTVYLHRLCCWRVCAAAVVLQGLVSTFLLRTWAPGRGRCPGSPTPSQPPWDTMWVLALVVDLRLESQMMQVTRKQANKEKP